MLVVPMNYYGSEESGLQRLLTEFLSVSFLIEDIPSFDDKSQVREALRRVHEWLIQQDKGREGYATPYGQHIHHSMPRLTELYIMATSCPWGYRAKWHSKDIPAPGGKNFNL